MEMNTDKLLHQSKRFFKKNGSTILTCVGAIGVVVTAVMTAKATPKATRLLELAEEEKGEDLTKLESIKVAGPVYIPATVVGAATISCIFGANVLNKRQQAALASAYALVDSSYKEYKQKLKELYGEETHNEIVNAIAVEKVDPELMVSGSYLGTDCDLTLEDTCGEPALFYEEYGNRYFEATVEQVISAEYHLNRNYILRGYAYLNELYDFLGLESTDYGSVLGWAPTDEGEYWVEFNHRKVVMDDGLECYILEMPFEPTYEPWDY